MSKQNDQNLILYKKEFKLLQQSWKRLAKYQLLSIQSWQEFTLTTTVELNLKKGCFN